jgi:hypothetical protein
MWDADLSTFDVATCYGLPEIMGRLKTKMVEEMPSHAVRGEYGSARRETGALRQMALWLRCCRTAQPAATPRLATDTVTSVPVRRCRCRLAPLVTWARLMPPPPPVLFLFPLSVPAAGRNLV